MKGRKYEKTESRGENKKKSKRRKERKVRKKRKKKEKDKKRKLLTVTKSCPRNQEGKRWKAPRSQTTAS